VTYVVNPFCYSLVQVTSTAQQAVMSQFLGIAPVPHEKGVT